MLKKGEVLRKNYLRHVKNEKRFLVTIRHPFIIHMEYFAIDVCNLYFVMPFALGGDLFNLIRQRGPLGEFNARFYSSQMVLAIEYLHKLNILYRCKAIVIYVRYLYLSR